jgi:hypothetical protein
MDVFQNNNRPYNVVLLCSSPLSAIFPKHGVIVCMVCSVSLRSHNIRQNKLMVRGFAHNALESMFMFAFFSAAFKAHIKQLKRPTRGV